MTATTLGLIVGNRGFFPSHLCQSGRETVLQVLQQEGIQVVALSPEETEYGSVESLSDQKLLAYICENGYEHHVSINLSCTASAVNEALSKYLGWQMYVHA